MKLLETYATATGLKIGKQFLTENYYPLPIDRYITIHASSGMAAKNYPYYAEVLALLKPELDAAGIGIIQIGSKDDPSLSGCYGTHGKTSIGQASYILSRSMLHIGNDSVWSHRAGYLNVPSVILFGSTSASNHGPYTHSDKNVMIESHRNGRRPTFASQENPQTIALIPPERIVHEALRLLNLADSVVQQTLHIGGAYLAPMLDWIPNTPASTSFHTNLRLIARLDLCDQIDNVVKTMNTGRRVDLFTKTPISMDILVPYNKFIASYNHEIQLDCPLAYIIQVKRLIPQAKFFTRLTDDASVASLRFQFFDSTNIEQVLDKTKNDFYQSVDSYLNLTNVIDKQQNPDILRFKTHKYVMSRDKIYLSHAHEQQDICMDTAGDRQVIDDPAFWRDINHYLIYQ